MIKTEVQTYLINIYVVIDDLKQYSPNLSVLEEVFDKSPILWELIERLKTIYNSDEWDQYIIFYNTAIKSQVRPENIYKFLSILLKRIYMFYDYPSRTVEAIDSAYEILFSKGKLEEEVKNSNVKKVKDAIDFLMYTFLPKLVVAYSICAQKVWTLDQYEGLRISLGFKPEDIIGVLAEEKKKERENLKTKLQSTAKSTNEKTSEGTRKLAKKEVELPRKFW